MLSENEKMSKKQGKTRQLSEKEIYRDAAQILEEVLENRLGRKSIKSTNSSNTNTYSSSGYYDASRESLDLWLKDDFSPSYSIERSQTMPSSFKLEEKDAFTEQDIKEYMKNKSDFAHRRHSGSATSGESDAEVDKRIGSPLRRKKSFYKRAKERLIISFRRQDQRREEEDDKDKTDKKEKKNKKTKKDKQVDKENNVKNSVDADDDFGDVQLRRGRNRSDSNISKRSSIFDSIRRSFRSKRKSLTESQSADAIGEIQRQGIKENNRRQTSVDIPESIPESSPLEPFQNHKAVIDLDDIPYIDEDTDKSKDKTIKEEDKELPKPKGNRNKPAPPLPEAPPINIKENIPGEPVKPEGKPLFEGHTGMSGDVIACGGGPTDEDDIDHPTKPEDEKPFAEKSDGEKNDMFEKIAIKLIEMADHIETKNSVNSSDGQSQETTDHSSSVDPDHLTSLEQEILECLRVGGDRLSQSFDDPVQVVVEQHRKQAYNRFYDTIRKGLGDEVSWHQLSMIYQIASGAVKAAGVGTQLAFRVKDMTQQYVGDKFAGWIVKEGGWDSMLSGSESEQS